MATLNRILGTLRRGVDVTVRIGGAETDFVKTRPTAPTPEHEEGLLFYSDQNKAVSYYNDKEDVEINVGKEEVARAKNVSGETLPNGTPVYINGAQGANPTIDKASELTESADQTVGLTTEELDNNEIGYITTQGEVRNLDTSDLTEGSQVYVNPNGGMQDTPPEYPNERTRVGVCTRSNPNNGTIFVKTVPNGKHFFTARGEPADPPPGEGFEWVSNGDGAGDEGDYMIKITDSSGTTKVATIVDFSAV